MEYNWLKTFILGNSDCPFIWQYHISWSVPKDKDSFKKNSWSPIFEIAWMNFLKWSWILTAAHSVIQSSKFIRMFMLHSHILWLNCIFA